MTINWYGQSCFRIETRFKNEEVVLFIDPFSKDIGLKPPTGKADIALITHDHYDHNNVSTLKGPNPSALAVRDSGQADGRTRGEPFIIDGPGEYEIKGINILGIPAYHDQKEGKEKGEVTMFILEIEGMTIAHLGDIGQSELSSDQLEKFEEIDILMIPVGGVYTVEPEEASKIINQIEPKIAIPMHYQIPGLNVGKKLADVEKFMKVMGLTKKELLEKLNVKKKDLIQEETQVIVMKVG